MCNNYYKNMVPINTSLRPKRNMRATVLSTPLNTTASFTFVLCYFQATREQPSSFMESEVISDTRASAQKLV
jgi:hypothetical protein